MIFVCFEALNRTINIQEIVRPNFVTFLKKLFEITAGKFRIVNRYEVGEKLGLDSSVTDDTVKQLSEMGMIKIMAGPKLLDWFYDKFKPNNDRIILIIMDVDAYSNGLNFVLGEAFPRGGLGAVFSQN
jgi:hypothetical protein